MKKSNDPELTIQDVAKGVAALTETVEMLASYINTINDVVLVLASKGIELPDWKTKDDVESVSEEVKKCVKLIRGIYGPGEADKS